MPDFLKPPRRYFKRPSGRGSQQRRSHQGRSVLVLLVLLLLWSLCLGWGLAQATEPKLPLLAQTPGANETVSGDAASIGTVDVVPDRLRKGQELYLARCATCHLGIPPAVMPTDTWRDLLQDPEHYGAEIRPFVDPDLRIVWEYMRTFSRPVAAEEEVPYRIYQSNYFKILHPKVKLPTRAGLSTCISCHPGADKYDFRRLSAEWQNAP